MGKGPQAWDGPRGPYTFGSLIPDIERMDFGTIEDIQAYSCNIKGCKWSDATVHEQWMFYGAGAGNLESWEPLACAERCARDVECGSFEFDITNKGVQYCSWWKVGACDEPKLGSDGGFGFNTCAKTPHPCPFMVATTGNTDELQCKNRNETTGFKSCYFVNEDMGESGIIVTNTDCCNDLGGRELCPPNYPVMCESRDCAGDYCCEATVDDCKALYGTGARKCSEPGPPDAPESGPLSG